MNLKFRYLALIWFEAIGKYGFVDISVGGNWMSLQSHMVAIIVLAPMLSHMLHNLCSLRL